MSANLTSAFVSLPTPSALLAHLPTSVQATVSSVIAKISSAASDGSWKTTGISLGLGYLVLVQALRFQREKSMRKRYGYPDRASLGKMTVEDAQKIIKDLASLEFPMMSETSLQFGLFKVCPCCSCSVKQVGSIQKLTLDRHTAWRRSASCC